MLETPAPPADARIPYGALPHQFGDLRLPQGQGPHPVVVVVNRKAMLTREGAVTEVLMPGEEGRPDRHDRTEKMGVSPHSERVSR